MPEGDPNTWGKLLLKPGTLWKSVIDSTNHALQCGALHSIPTEYEFVEQGGVCFLVRILSNLIRKDEAKQKQEKEKTTSGKEFNPFLPYEKDLFVADISNTHVCILNKYNVVNYHLLVITREFEQQETVLTLQDFEAMWACLAEFEGLAFYNSGKMAGASQRHKHLQLVPLPLTPQGPQVPIEPLLGAAKFHNSLGNIPGFAFAHAFVHLDHDWIHSPLKAAEVTLKRYYTLLHAVGLLGDGGANENRLSAPYNLLATRQWMLIVPRSHESFESISVNSLGFAGALLVRNEQQMQLLKDCGPMTLLRSVAVSAEC